MTEKKQLEELLAQFIGDRHKNREENKRLNNAIKNTREDLRKIERIQKEATKSKVSLRFAMQVAKEKELREYIKALRVKVASCLRKHGATREEIQNVLGISMSALISERQDIDRAARRNNIDRKFRNGVSNEQDPDCGE